MTRRSVITGGRGDRQAISLVVVGLCLALVGFGAAAPRARAAGRSHRCKKGTVQVKLGKKDSCLPGKLVLPPPSNTNPVVANVQGGLRFAQLSFKTRSGKRVRSFSQQLGGSWATAQGRLQRALAAMIARQQRTGRRLLGGFAIASSGQSAGCALAEIIGEGAIDENGKVVKSSDSLSVGGTDVTLGIDGGGMHLGLSTTVNGDTYTMKYDSGDVSCLPYELPPCPEADGSLNAFGIKGKTGFSVTATRGGQVLKKMSYKKTITVETRGQVADDAKLDYVDVKYGETTDVVLDGTHLTQYGNRNARINMRSGSYDAGESTSFGSVSNGGAIANVAGVEADAKGFAAFVSQTISAYRNRETAWQTPNKCAKLKFNPGSGTLTLAPGEQGSLGSEVDAVANGDRAAKASWTLSGQQNGTFSPTSSKDPQPSFSYEVSANPSGNTLSVVVKATSSAGVAQETWSQKVSAINKISGSFSGHEVDTLGVTYDWSGTVTFVRSDTETGGSVFSLASGTATVTVSGTGVDGCTHAGSEEIPLSPLGVLTVMGTGKPYQYQILAPWDNRFHGGTVVVTCPGPSTSTETEIPDASAIQSGDISMGANPAGLIKTSADGVIFADSASESDVVVGSANWTWSLKGEP